MPNAQFCRCPKSLNYINKERHTVKTQKFTADHVFVFSEENKCDYELGPGQSYQVIGFPRCYQSWIKFIKAASSKKSYQTFESLKKLRVAIFMSSSVHGAFSEEENFEWICEVIASLDKCRAKFEIVIKAHPMISLELRNKIKEKFGEKIKFTENQVGLVSYQANLVILRHTSAILDAVCFGTPTIFYQKFTDHWLKRHPAKSHFLPFVKFLAEDVDALNQNLKSVVASISAGKNFDGIYASAKQQLSKENEFPRSW